MDNDIQMKALELGSLGDKRDKLTQQEILNIMPKLKSHICSYCGCNIRDGSKYCDRCGERIK